MIKTKVFKFLRMKYFVWILIAIALISGATALCNLNQVNFTGNQTVNLTGGYYETCGIINTTANPAIRPKASNIYLNISNSTIQDNGSSRFFYDSNFGFFNNITIDGGNNSGNISGYTSRYIEIYGDRHTLKNFNVGNSSTAQIVASLSDADENWTVTGIHFNGIGHGDNDISMMGLGHLIAYNTFTGFSTSAVINRAMINVAANNSNISNNLISNGYDAILIKGSNNTIKKNIVNNSLNKSSDGGCVKIQNTSSTYNRVTENNCVDGNVAIYIGGINNTISYNNQTNETFWRFWWLDKDASGNNISNNFGNLTDQGLYCSAVGLNNIFSYNTILNANTNFDAWGVGEYLNGCNNLTSYQNNITNFQGAGILMNNATNIFSNESAVVIMSLPDKITLAKEDQGEVACAYNVGEYFRGYIGGIGYNFGDNQSVAVRYRNSNITIYTPVTNYGNNTQTYLCSQDTVNLISPFTKSDSTTNWYRKFGVPYYVDNIEYYNNVNYSALYQVFGGSGARYDLHLTLGYWRFCGLAVCNVTNNISDSKLNYSISKVSMNFSNNINFSYTYNLYLASNYIPYNDVLDKTTNVGVSYNVNNFSSTLNQRSTYLILNLLNGGSIYGPNILAIWDLNMEDYFDREIKNYFGAIEALPDMTNNYAAHALISPTLPNLTVNVTFPLAQMMNVYVNGMSNGTAIDYATVHLYYTSIYGGRIGEVASYNCTVQ